MERRTEVPVGRGVSPAIGWLGMAWVWSGLFWLMELWQLSSAGMPIGAVAVALRLAATLALGIGLCATERWAWASAVCLSALYAALAGLLAAAALARLATLPPATLSWMPVFLGLNPGRTARIAFWALLAAAGAGVNLALLWREQPHFDVPYRRPFTVLLNFGGVPAFALLSLDLFLLYGWWQLALRA